MENNPTTYEESTARKCPACEQTIKAEAHTYLSWVHDSDN
jgi:hypothetical protein